MSLTRPSIGEYLDRLSILKLKIGYGEKAGYAIEHFRDEMHEILGALPDSLNMAADPVQDIFAVNELLWTLTDNLRRAIATHHREQERSLGVAILHANDERARLIQAINEDHGDFRKEKFA